MIGEALTRAEVLRARSQRFRDMVSRTYERLHDTLQQCETPYVALSGGKDSTVVLHMASQLQPDIPAMWLDDELEYDGTPEHLRAIAGSRLKIRGWRTGPRGVRLGAGHAGWFLPWSSAPFWREPEPDMVIYEDTWWHDISIIEGHDGVLTGVRGQESRTRRIHAVVRGDTYEHAVRKQIVIQPIIDWSIDDVWAYIAMTDLPYHPVYDAMSAAGISRDKQRVGPLPLTPRWVLAAIDPTLPARLEARYGRRW